jgi:glycerophosphoryl diester phosphodiesterase
LPFALFDRRRAPAPDPAHAGWLGAWVFAHRGVHGSGVEENSTGAFARAMERGWGIECDVRLSKDERAIVFHDATLDRLTGHPGRLDELRVADITRLALIVGGETVPTLRDMLDQVAGRVPLLLEIKTDRGQSMRLVRALCRTVRRELDGYGGHVAVMSFDPRVGSWFARKAPTILRGLVVTEQGSRTFSGTIKRHLAMWDARAQFLAYDVRDLPSTFADRQRRRGLPVLTWTVNSPSLRERAAQYADAPIAEAGGLPTGDA